VREGLACLEKEKENAMKLLVCLVAFVSLVTASIQAQVIVDDSWADAGRGNGVDALDAAWWSSVSSNNSSVEVSAGSLGLVTGTSGRGLHGTFAAQTLAIGDTLTATLTFMTPATVGSPGSAAFRIALADFNNAGLAADLQSSSSFSQPFFTNLPTYMVDFDVNAAGVADDTSMRKYNLPNTGRWMGTTTGWTQLGTSPDVDYAFTPNTQYVVVMSLTRTGLDSMDIFGSLTGPSGLLTSHTLTDTNGIVNNIGVLGVWANSSTFGSSGTIGAADNGIDFSNIKIEVIPEPSTLTLALFGLATMALAKKFRRRR
jgi:hypothetical protein